MMSSKPWIAILLIVSVAASGCLGTAGTDDLQPERRSDIWADFPAPQGETPLTQSAHALREADTRLFDGLPAAPTLGPSIPLREALAGLAADHGHTLGIEDTLALETLALVPQGTADAASDLVQAFRLLEKETAAAYADASAPRFDRVVVAQHLVMEKATALERAVDEFGTASAQAGPITFLNVFALELSGTATSYWVPYHLTIDVGGDDTYHNNAGGNGVEGCGAGPLLAPYNAPAAAALIDLAGDDQYIAQRDCGIAGGALLGSGLLIDAGGDDLYDNGGRGTNGGGYATGIGLLVDADGFDTYLATGAGTNGGGYAGGIGRLIDRTGNDHYEGLGDGVNGGASGGYHCRPVCQNAPLAQGLLLDIGGTDFYRDFQMRDRSDATAIPKEHYGVQLDFAITV